MDLRSFCLALALTTTALAADPKHDSKAIFEAIKTGKSLDADGAAKLEARLAKKPGDALPRIQLLSYYTTGALAKADVAAAKAGRAKHILWIIENDPKDSIGLDQVATGIDRINCQGDPLADPAALRQAADAWLAQVKKHPSEKNIRRQARDFTEICEPGIAGQFAEDSADRARLAATRALGVDRVDYERGYAAGTDPEWRKRPEALRAVQDLQQAAESGTDPGYVVTAAVSLLGTGASLWSKGQLDWDYTKLGLALLERAKTLSPSDFRLFTAPTKLPAPGEEPTMTIRVGGNVMVEKLVKKVTPKYPKDAKYEGIQGTVRFTVLVGLDGKILSLALVSGHPDLVEPSAEAVKQWLYKPTLLNGKPCFVITVIDVNYVLR